MADNTPKRIGIDFLIQHISLENSLLTKTGIEDKVIVNKKDYAMVINFFNEYPDQFDKMVKQGGKANDNEMEITL